MRLEQLKYIVTIAEYMSFSKASERLFLSPQALSRSMTSLEKELDVTIFTRFATGVQLTSDGEKIVAMSKNILKEYEMTMALIQGKTKDASKTIINVYAHSNHIDSFLNHIALKYMTEKGNVRIMIKEFNMNAAVKINKRQNNDNFNWVCFSAPFGKEKSLMFKQLPEDAKYITDDHFNSKYVACINREHALSQQKEISLKMLKSVPFVRFALEGGEENDNAADIIDFHFKGQRIQTSYRVNNLASWLAAIENGFGVGLMDQLVCSKQSRCKKMFDNVKILKINDSPTIQHLFVASTNCSKEVDDFIDYAVKELKYMLK